MMENVQQQRNLLLTIAMLMMFLDIPVVNSLASNTLMNNHLTLQHHRRRHHQQQKYRIHHYRADNMNTWTSLSLPYTIGSTIVKDKIPERLQDLSYSLADVLVTDTNPIIRTLDTLMTVTTSTWRKIKNAMTFDKQAFAKLGIGFGLTYSFISNINGSITLSVAWYFASIKVRLYIYTHYTWNFIESLLNFVVVVDIKQCNTLLRKEIFNYTILFPFFFKDWPFAFCNWPVEVPYGSIC